MLSALSPQRRRLALAAGTLAALLAATLVVARVRHPAGSSPVDAAPQDRPGPVLLVPGYGGSLGSFDVLRARLAASGRDVRLVPLPGEGTGDLRASARVLRDVADRALAETGSPSVDVVGYSAGGVVARLWVRDYGGAAKARRVVTLGSPHHGAAVAGQAAVFAPDACPEACRQLDPGSSLLRALNRGDETPAGPRWLAVWSEQDETVTPVTSARLAGAVDVALQSVCPDARLGHGDLPRDPLPVGLVVRALGPEPLRPPAPADCRALRALGA